MDRSMRLPKIDEYLPAGSSDRFAASWKRSDTAR